MEHIAIEECCDILDSRRIPITASDRMSGPYPYYGANGVQDYVADYIFDDELVLLAEDGGNFGSKTRPIAYRVSGKCWVNNHAHVLKPMASMDVDYLCYSLMFYDTGELVNGATRQKLTQTAMRKMLIPQRSLQEQKRIVCELSKVQSIISARQQQLQKLDELVKARFVEMFGDYIKDDRRPLSEVAIITGGLTKNSNRNIFETKMPYLRVANVFYNRLDLREILEIGVKEEEIEKTLLQAGDLLFVEGNGSIEQIGRVAIWDGSIDPILHQNHLIKARFNNEIIAPEYALFYFMLQDGRQQIISKSVSTSGLNTLSVNKVSSLLLPIPPIALQKQFGEFFKQTDKSKVAVQKALDEAQLLFDSLMQKYFE